MLSADILIDNRTCAAVQDANLLYRASSCLDYAADRETRFTFELRI